MFSRVFILLGLQIAVTCLSKATALAVSGRGGRPATSADSLGIQAYENWNPQPPKPNECKLTIVQITDVYTLENFASLKTMLKQTREAYGEGKVISMLTGDFLSPYLLSSVDQGAGMVSQAMLNTYSELGFED